MPTQPYTAGELADTRLLLEVAEALVQDGDESDEEVADMLVLAAVEPLQRSHLQDIGPEKLSVRRLQREAAALGRDSDDVSVTTYIKYGFRLEWLPLVVQALEVPDEIETINGHFGTGEEAVLLLLRRYRSTDPLRSMTWETGRSISAISEMVWHMVLRRQNP